MQCRDSVELESNPAKFGPNMANGGSTGQLRAASVIDRCCPQLLTDGQQPFSNDGRPQIPQGPPGVTPKMHGHATLEQLSGQLILAAVSGPAGITAQDMRRSCDNVKVLPGGTPGGTAMSSWRPSGRLKGSIVPGVASGGTTIENDCGAAAADGLLGVASAVQLHCPVSGSCAARVWRQADRKCAAMLMFTVSAAPSPSQLHTHTHT